MEGIFPPYPSRRSIGSPMTYRPRRIRIQKYQGFAEPEHKSVKASPNPDIIHRLRRRPRSTLGKPSGNARFPVTSAAMPEAGKPKHRRVANWPMVRGTQPRAVTSQDIYSTAACGAVDVPEYRRGPHGQC